MKIKQRPEDFVVRELDRYEVSKSGPFALYTLLKWDIGTIEALQRLASQWKISRARISFGGLKDRHARTEQVISIVDGPPRDFEGSAFRASYLGRSRQPITRASFDGNRFDIVVRHLTQFPDLEPVRRFGLPNYFDDQRFGSLRGTQGEFIGRELVRGRLENALKLALASPDALDRRSERALKDLVRRRWGDWTGLKDELPSSPQRTVAAYLAGHPGAFGFAFELLDENLRILYVSAYQSYLWNRTLSELLRPLPDTFEMEYSAGRHLFYAKLDPAAHDGLAELSIPLITPTQRFEPPLAPLVERLLREEGVEARQFRLKRLRRTFFGKGLRSALVAPADLRSARGDDELNPGRKKWTLSFELPKGAYATVLIKRLFHEPLRDAPGADEEAPGGSSGEAPRA
jgi:tRNA pseudouridine13 synthase